MFTTHFCPDNFFILSFTSFGSVLWCWGHICSGAGAVVLTDTKRVHRPNHNKTAFIMGDKVSIALKCCYFKAASSPTSIPRARLISDDNIWLEWSCVCYKTSRYYTSAILRRSCGNKNNIFLRYAWTKCDKEWYFYRVLQPLIANYILNPFLR